MATVSGLVAELVDQGSFDVSEVTVLAWLDRRHKEMVNHARAYRSKFAIDTTVSGTSEYEVPAGVIEMFEVTVGGERFAPGGRHADLADVGAGWLWLSGPGGLVIRSASASAVTTLALLPPPAQSGLEIEGYGCLTPPTLLLDDSVALLVDDDQIEGLKAGVFATGLGGPGQGQADEAAAQLALFEAAKEDARRRERRRWRGSGPAVMRIAGRDA